jgi:mannitol-1-phosphate 5-dehydrogenase
MPTLVQFGAGNIGRGFIAPLFSAAGWEVVFVDVAAPVIAELNARRAYTVTEVDGQGERAQRVAPVRGIDGRDSAAVIAALTAADLAATAVGLGALPHLAPALAAALAHRRRGLDVLVCENGARAAEALREAVAARLDPALLPLFGFVRTTIGRMIPPNPATGLDIRVEPYAHLPCERAAFCEAVPLLIPGLEPQDDFELTLRRKLYLHNLTHACLAYAGHQRALATIRDCVRSADLAMAARQAGEEASRALARAHGSDAAGRAAIRSANRALLDDLFTRYANPALDDPVARVTRDPWRKLAADDRMVGAARLCAAQGVAAPGILRHIALACAYSAAADEPRAAEWNTLPVAERLRAASGLPADDPVLQTVAQWCSTQARERRL